jgi:hypothetical protein
MTPERDGALTEVRATAQGWTTREETTTAKARALALDLAALSAGLWDPTQEVLDALCALAWATVWDLATVAA